MTAMLPPSTGRPRHLPLHPASGNAPLTGAYCKTLYRQRHKVENMFAKLKDWRCLALRCDRCARMFFSTICLASTVILWLGKRVLTLVFWASAPTFRRARRVEDLFTETIAWLFERRPCLCLSLLDDLDWLAPVVGEDQRHIRVATQKSFVAFIIAVVRYYANRAKRRPSMQPSPKMAGRGVG